MRTLGVWLRLLSAAWLVALGCHNRQNLRPPKRPEEYTLPPEAEARFSKPIAYPEGTPNSSIPRKKLLGNGPGGGSGLGMGAPGMGMGGGPGGGMGGGMGGGRPY
jgi:hypothetical protein